MGRPDPAGGEDIGEARPERIECIDDRSLLVANHPHFLEIDADRRQIFRDIADVLVLGAAGQDLATDHQERGRDGLFGSGRICGCHDHLQENAPNDEPTQDGKHASSSSALTLPLWVMLLQVTVAENWKRDFAQLYVTHRHREAG